MKVYFDYVFICRLNLNTFVWEIVYLCQGAADYEPEGRYRHEVCFDNRNIYVLGGGTAMDVYDLCVIPVFSLDRNLWHPQKTQGGQFVEFLKKNCC